MKIISFAITIILTDICFAQIRTECLSKSSEHGKSTSKRLNHEEIIYQPDFHNDMQLYQIAGCQNQFGKITSLTFKLLTTTTYPAVDLILPMHGVEGEAKDGLTCHNFKVDIGTIVTKIDFNYSKDGLKQFSIFTDDGDSDSWGTQVEGKFKSLKFT